MYSLLLVFFFVSLVFSFLCSLWEAVLLSVTPTYARLKVQQGAAIGDSLLSFKKDIDRPLAGILTLNTVAHTVGAIGVGVQASAIWADAHPLIPGLAVPAAMTLAILILSEIIPKTLGANYWESLAPFTVRSLKFVMTALYPLVWMSQLITRTLKRKRTKSVFSRSEFLAMAEIGAEEGVFAEREKEMIGNLLRFSSVKTRDIMTPRTVMKTALANTTIQEFFDKNPEARFSRIPLFNPGAPEHAVGYVHKRDVLHELVAKRGGRALKEIQRDIFVVLDTFALPRLFRELMERREHIAIVVNEFGGIVGLVTMEDTIETLLGLEIVDEFDKTADLQAMARKAWEKRARALGLVPAEKEK